MTMLARLRRRSRLSTTCAAQTATSRSPLVRFYLSSARGASAVVRFPEKALPAWPSTDIFRGLQKTDGRWRCVCTSRSRFSALVAALAWSIFEMASNFSPNRTYVAKPGEIEQKWWHVDGSDQVVGRLAADIAMILMGKHKPTYTPHVDVGDFVVVTNAEKVVFTGKKWGQKRYTWYTGYTGLREETAARRLENQPTQLLREAVRRMLPKNKLARHRLLKLKVYAGPEHPHQAQQPVGIQLGKVVETGK